MEAGETSYGTAVREAISDRVLLERGSAGKIVASTRREIEELSRQPAWTNHWSGEGEIPDYSRVRERMEALLNSPLKKSLDLFS